jgi:hypothetical protein
LAKLLSSTSKKSSIFDWKQKEIELEIPEDCFKLVHMKAPQKMQKKKKKKNRKQPSKNRVEETPKKKQGRPPKKRAEETQEYWDEQLHNHRLGMHRAAPKWRVLGCQFIGKDGEAVSLMNFRVQESVTQETDPSNYVRTEANTDENDVLPDTWLKSLQYMFIIAELHSPEDKGAALKELMLDDAWSRPREQPIDFSCVGTPAEFKARCEQSRVEVRTEMVGRKHLIIHVIGYPLPPHEPISTRGTQMSACTYCGADAGRFKDAHEEAAKKYAVAIESLQRVTADAVSRGREYEDVKASLERLIIDNKISQVDATAAFKAGWSDGAALKSHEQPLTVDEFNGMHRFFKAAAIDSREMVKTPGFAQSSFSWLVWQVLHGEVVEYEGPVRFNLLRGEIPVFGFGSVILYEERTTSSYVGDYSGASTRIGRGLYYHVNGIRGRRVQTSSLQEIDYGQALITTQSLYFGGDKMNFRVPYSHTVRFEPYEDGIGIDKNQGRKQVFVVYGANECGWFLYNVMQALATANLPVKRMS